jgi:hypothetical protein
MSIELVGEKNILLFFIQKNMNFGCLKIELNQLRVKFPS